MPTIITKNSSTAAAVPTTSDLVQGELAVNVADKRIFTENSSTQIIELGTNPSSLTTPTATVTGTLTANGTFNSSNAVVTGGSVNGVVIGASNPLAITKDGIDKLIVDKELEIIKAETTNSGKPVEMAEKISKGKILKFLNDNSLLEQIWIMDPKKKVSDILKENRMTLAIDMVGTNLGSGTRTYNVNFCEYLDKQTLNEKIFIFVCNNYRLDTNTNTNSNIKYIVKPSFLTNIFFRIIWMQFFLPFELKKLKIDKLYSPMNFGPIFLKLFKLVWCCSIFFKSILINIIVYCT